MTSWLYILNCHLNLYLCVKSMTEQKMQSKRDIILLRISSYLYTNLLSLTHDHIAILT